MKVSMLTEQVPNPPVFEKRIIVNLSENEARALLLRFDTITSLKYFPYGSELFELTKVLRNILAAGK